MFDASPRTLKLLAFLVWSSGAVVMLIKCSGVLVEAAKLNPDKFWIWLAILSGLLIGVIKARYLFRKLCLGNMTRIDVLDKPKLWHFYRPRFFVFLVAMVVIGLYLSSRAHDNYSMLIGLSILELSVATALLGTIGCFRRVQ